MTFFVTQHSCKGEIYKEEISFKQGNLGNFVAAFVKEKCFKEALKENFAVWCYIDRGNDNTPWKDDIFY